MKINILTSQFSAANSFQTESLFKLVPGENVSIIKFFYFFFNSSPFFFLKL